jgi:hypothetical protein
MSQPMVLGHAFPCSHTLYAVVADAEGNPVFHRVHCMGMLQNQHHCVAVGMIDSEGHLEAADSLPAHVGYATEFATKDEWAAKCAARRAELVAAEAEKAKSKILVPDRTVKPVFH